MKQRIGFGAPIGPVWVNWLVLASLTIGCGGETGPKTYTATGSVTLDGQPIESGNIIFHGDDPSQGPDAGKIVNGTFSFPAKAGTKRVQINATRPVPGKTRIGADDTPVPVREQYIPERFNSPQSELNAEVVANGANTFNFQLKSKAD